jgi:V/A-type H+-transporting ATPase subunit E
MSKQDIVERILFDANTAAEELVAAARKRAEAIEAEANARAEAMRSETEAQVVEYDKDVKEKRKAAARLESAKILLAEKRKVLDYLYVEALRRLKTLSKEDMLALMERLLETYAEEGDEIVFAEGFAYVQDVLTFPVITDKKLTVSKQAAEIEGGFLLRGVASDKDLSFEALIAQDKEEHLSEIAAEIF